MKNSLSLLLALLLIASTASAQRFAKSVKVPNFVLTDVAGEKVNLQALLKDNERVLLCFFRPVWCPICNKRTHELIERYEELKAKGIEVVAIYPSKPEIMAQYVKDAEIPFPVIADPAEALYEIYSIERSLKKVQATMQRSDFNETVSTGMKLYGGKSYGEPGDSPFINADFIVSSRRMLDVAYYGEYVGDHYSLDEL